MWNHICMHYSNFDFIDLAKRWLQAAFTYMYNEPTKLQIPNTYDGRYTMWGNR